MKVYQIHLSIGWFGSVDADGQFEEDGQTKFYTGPPSNVIASYPKVSVIRINEIDWKLRSITSVGQVPEKFPGSASC